MRYRVLTLALSIASGAFVVAGQEQSALKPFTIEGQPGSGTETVEARTSAIGLDYFREQRLPLLRGRMFIDRDTRDSYLVAIVSESFAARAWPNLDPVGRRLKSGGPDSKSNWMTVIGVAADARIKPANLPIQPHVYSCSLQSTTSLTSAGR